MSPQKRARQLQALFPGLTVTKTPGGHLKLSHPKADRPVFTASTSTSSTGWHNTIAKMRRALRAA